MKVFRDPTLVPPFDHPLIAIGVFDGVHRGHQAILTEMVEDARQTGGTALMLTFHPHPQKVIRPSEAPPLLQTWKQKEEGLAELGLDALIRLPFTRRLSLLSPREFVEQVLSPLKPREVRVGANFRFGHRREGDYRTLAELGEEYDFSVRPTEVVQFRGDRISSTRIRRLLSQGRVGLAKRLLGRTYEIRGTVVRGAGRGADLGFPTANLEIENELIPAPGVYATRACFGGRKLAGATNIGYRPTIEEEPEVLTVETFLLDFDENLYGRHMSLEFCLRLRAERRFASVDALQHQMERDVEVVRRYARRAARFFDTDDG